MLTYPAKLEPAPGGGFVVTFRDVPEAITQGETESDAYEAAAEALALALEFYAERGSEFPSSSSAVQGEGEIMVTLPAHIAAKLELYRLMCETKTSRSELGRRLGVDERTVRRLLDHRQRSSLHEIERAFASLGKRLEIAIGDSA